MSPVIRCLLIGPGVCILHSDCAKTSTYANRLSLDDSLAGACCMSTAGKGRGYLVGCVYEASVYHVLEVQLRKLGSSEGVDLVARFRTEELGSRQPNDFGIKTSSRNSPGTQKQIWIRQGQEGNTCWKRYNRIHKAEQRSFDKQINIGRMWIEDDKCVEKTASVEGLDGSAKYNHLAEGLLLWWVDYLRSHLRAIKLPMALRELENQSTVKICTLVFMLHFKGGIRSTTRYFSLLISMEYCLGIQLFYRLNDGKVLYRLCVVFPKKLVVFETNSILIGLEILIPNFALVRACKRTACGEIPESIHWMGMSEKYGKATLGISFLSAASKSKIKFIVWDSGLRVLKMLHSMEWAHQEVGCHADDFWEKNIFDPCFPQRYLLLKSALDKLTCSMLQPSCHLNYTFACVDFLYSHCAFCTVTVHQNLVESLWEKGGPKALLNILNVNCRQASFFLQCSSIIPHHNLRFNNMPERVGITWECKPTKNPMRGELYFWFIFYVIKTFGNSEKNIFKDDVPSPSAIGCQFLLKWVCFESILKSIEYTKVFKLIEFSTSPNLEKMKPGAANAPPPLPSPGSSSNFCCVPRGQ
ncbi:putative signal peptide protein [Puccinia sorghi]|uniref:Putative signal peptide protein n=1 Tax=Puccinia sorghi TaxID=27349 RepID=A0A0L6UX77_9BASI|nr:putative signal peptide protein [Puccinia sorghi]